MGTLRTLHPRLILHARSAISVHTGVLLGKTRTRALRFGAECPSDLSTVGLLLKDKDVITVKSLLFVK